LRLAVEDHSSIFENEKISITVSIGLVKYNNTDNLDNLMKKADKALYEAKAQGRNRIAINT